MKVCVRRPRAVARAPSTGGAGATPRPMPRIQRALPRGLRQQLQHDRLLPSHVTPLTYTPVEAGHDLMPKMDIHKDARGLPVYHTDSAAMREALAAIDVEAELERLMVARREQAESENTAAEVAKKQSSILRRDRYNWGAPLKVDWKYVPWAVILSQMSKLNNDLLHYLEPSRNRLHDGVLNASAYHTMEAHLMTPGPHPAARIMQLWTRDRKRGSRGRNTMGWALRRVTLAFAFQECRRRIVTETNRQVLLVESAALKALWQVIEDNPSRRHPLSFYHYCQALAALGDIQALEELQLSHRQYVPPNREGRAVLRRDRLLYTAAHRSALSAAALHLEGDERAALEYIEQFVPNETPQAAGDDADDADEPAPSPRTFDALASLMALKPLIVHYLTVGDATDREAAWSWLSRLTLPPEALQHPFTVSAWTIAGEIVQADGLSKEDASRILETLFPYFASHFRHPKFIGREGVYGAPGARGVASAALASAQEVPPRAKHGKAKPPPLAWLHAPPEVYCDEVLEGLMTKAASTKEAYTLMKEGVNAGLPEFSEEVVIPPSRASLRAMLRVCVRCRRPDLARTVFEQMLHLGCRPHYDEIHALLMAHAAAKAPGDRDIYCQLLKWCSVQPELVPADETLIRGFAKYTAAAAHEADADRLFGVFTNTISLLGGVDQRVVTALMTALLKKGITAADGPDPITPFIDMLMFFTTNTLPSAYHEKKHILRLSNATFVSAVLHAYERAFAVAGILPLEEPLLDAHAQWSGAGVALATNKKGAAYEVPVEKIKGGASSPGADEFAAQMPVIDAWLLNAHGMYSTTPFRTGVPPNATRVVLIHWSTLLWCTDAEQTFQTNPDAGVHCAVPTRHLQHMMCEVRRMQVEHEEAVKMREHVDAVADDEKFGGQITEAIESIRESNVTLAQVEGRAHNILADRATLITYDTEIDAAAGLPLRDADNAPSAVAFAALAEQLAATGAYIECIVDSPAERARVEAALAGVESDWAAAAPSINANITVRSSNAGSGDTLDAHLKRERAGGAHAPGAAAAAAADDGVMDACTAWEAHTARLNLRKHFRPVHTTASFMHRRFPAHDHVLHRMVQGAFHKQTAAHIVSAQLGRRTYPDDLVRELPWKMA